MYTMYTTIEALCEARGIRIGKLCADLKISRGVMGDLKSGRTRNLGSENLQKIASYFDVSTDYLLTGHTPGYTPRPFTDEELKFALWGNADIDDDDLADVRRYAEFIRARRQGG